MRVIGLVGVARHAIGERREFGRNHERGADDGRFRRAGKARHVAGRTLASLEP
jgi:hypothetical protein